LTARALRANGYDVRTAGTGAEMWVMLDSAPADLIVLDIMLPGTTGIELFRKLRKESDTPVIFVSARGSGKTAFWALNWARTIIWPNRSARVS
jgi:DNA-binding response OmpR family regulator